MLLDRPDPVRIGDLGMTGAVHHVQRVNRSAGLRVNTRERVKNVFAIETVQHVVKQSEPVWSLNLNERVSGMHLVIDGDASRKFDCRSKATALAPGLFDQW